MEEEFILDPFICEIKDERLLILAKNAQSAGEKLVEHILKSTGMEPEFVYVQKITTESRNHYDINYFLVIDWYDKMEKYEIKKLPFSPVDIYSL